MGVAALMDGRKVQLEVLSGGAPTVKGYSGCKYVQYVPTR